MNENDQAVASADAESYYLENIVTYSREMRAYTLLTREINYNICVLYARTDNKSYTRLSDMGISDLTAQLLVSSR